MIKLYVYEDGMCHTYNQNQQGTIKNFDFKVNEKVAEISWSSGKTILKSNQSLELEDIRFMLMVQESAWKMISFQESVTMGRSNQNDICISNDHISSYHLSLETKSDKIEIKDLGSTNGTYCDGVQFEKIQVEAGTIILVACIEIIVFCNFVLCRNFDQNQISVIKKKVDSNPPLDKHHGVLDVQIAIETMELEITHVGYENV